MGEQLYCQTIAPACLVDHTVTQMPVLFPSDEGGKAARFCFLFCTGWLWSFAVFGRVLFFLGSVCAIKFRARTFGETAQANRTPHTPPARVVCFFPFLSPPHCFVRLFWPCVFSVLGFLRGSILGTARFFGTSLRPLSWTRGGRGVCSFLFVVCCFSRSVVFAATHVPRRPTRHSMPQGAIKQVVSPAPWGSAPQVWFFVASVGFGSQGPTSLFVRWGDCCVAPRLSHARFFPGLSLSFSLSLSLSFAAFRLPRRVSMQKCFENTLELREIIDPQPHLRYLIPELSEWSETRTSPKFSGRSL